MLFLNERRNLILLISTTQHHNLVHLIQYNIATFFGYIFRDEDGNRILKEKTLFLWGSLKNINRNFKFQRVTRKSFFINIKMFEILIDWLYNVTIDTIYSKYYRDNLMERFIYTCYCVFYTACFCGIDRRKFQLLGISWLYYMGVVLDLDKLILVCDNYYPKEEVISYLAKENKFMESLRQIQHTKLPPKLHFLIKSLNNTQSNFKKETLNILSEQLGIHPKLQLHKIFNFKNILIGFLSCPEIYNHNVVVKYKQEVRFSPKQLLPPKINILMESLNDEHTDFKKEVLSTLPKQLEIYPKLYKTYDFIKVLMNFISHPKMYYISSRQNNYHIPSKIPPKINILLNSLNNTRTNFDKKKSSTLFEKLKIYPKLTENCCSCSKSFRKIFVYCLSCPEMYK